jgi:hypothetical protein
MKIRTRTTLCKTTNVLRDVQVELPQLMIVGRGRAGKDEFGMWFNESTTMKFSGSTSHFGCDMMAKHLGISREEAWNTRHQSREKWKEFFDSKRDKDPLFLVRMSLKKNDIVAGCRDIREIEGAKEEGLVDLVIWIENSRVPADPTVLFSSADADIVIENNGTLEEYFKKLEALARTLGVIDESRLEAYEDSRFQGFHTKLVEV